MRWKELAWCGLAVLLLAPRPGAAATLHGQASTVFQWWQDPDDGQDAAPLTQYLSFVAAELLKGQGLTIQGYGQINKDTASGEPWRGKVYYLYADWRDAWKEHLDLRAGRQFSQNAAGSAVLDGLDATLRNLGPLQLRVFGGGNVQYIEDYQWGDAAGGASLSLAGFEHTYVELAAFLTWSDSDLAREIFGLSATQDLWKWGRVYGDVQYDYLGDEFNEYLLGLRVFPATGWTLTGEYFESLPVFDSTSIYSVFAVERYREARLKAAWDPSWKVRLYAGGMKIWYDEGGDAWEGVAGTRLLSGAGTRLEVELSRRFGSGGDLNGVHAALGHEILPKRLTAEIGADYQRFQREERETEDYTSGYWGSVEYRWTKMLATSARVENLIDAGGKNHVEGILRADVGF